MGEYAKEQDGAHLEGWCGVAVVLLLTGQFFPVPGLDLGSVAADLIFVLAGLLVARTMFGGRADPGTLWRRAAWVAPSLAFFVACMTWWFSGTATQPEARDIAAALTFTGNYFLAQPNLSASVTGQLWALAVIVQGSLLMWFIAYLVRKHITGAAYALGATACVFAACALAYWRLDSDLRFTSMYRYHLEVAALGMFASAFLSVYGKRLNIPVPSIAVSALLVIGIAANLSPVPSALKIVIGCAAFALAINLIDRHPGKIRNLLQSDFLRRLGMWSFSIYLWQQPFQLIVRNGELHPIAGLAGGLAAGIAAFYLIESPARRYLTRAWPGRTSLTLVYSV